MNLLKRVRLHQPSETWPGLSDAAETRFWEGYELALADHRTGSIYLMGYTVEMLLKVALYRCFGVPNSHDLNCSLTSHPRSSPRELIRTHAKWHGRNLHDISGLFDLLSDLRKSAGHVWDHALDTAMRKHVDTVSSHWREYLRYRWVEATETQLREFEESANWLFLHQAKLWS
jgi:hypothetical protein